MQSKTSASLFPISERAWQTQVREIALRFGWWVYHTWDSRHSEQGLPDLILMRRRDGESQTRILFAELKSPRGKVTDSQEWVLEMLRRGGKPEVHLWRPQDMDQVIDVLK